MSRMLSRTKAVRHQMAINNIQQCQTHRNPRSNAARPVFYPGMQGVIYFVLQTQFCRVLWLCKRLQLLFWAPNSLKKACTLTIHQPVSSKHCTFTSDGHFREDMSGLHAGLGDQGLIIVVYNFQSQFAQAQGKKKNTQVLQKIISFGLTKNYC